MNRKEVFISERLGSRETGISLIEVIVAIVLMGIVSAGAVTFFISSSAAVSDNQRTQLAVTLANSALDQARSVPTVEANVGGAANPSGLVRGRSQAAVDEIWNMADDAGNRLGLEPSDVADMGPVWDSRGTYTDADQWVPITKTDRVSNQSFNVSTIVGYCYRPKAPTTVESECVAQVQSLDTHLKMYRVRIVVAWAESDTAPVQSYRLSTLLDPSPDVMWNTILRPFAYDDEYTLLAGASNSFHAVVANDVVDYNASGTRSPIVDVSTVSPAGSPAYLTTSVGAGTQINGVVLNHTNTEYSGLVNFTYKVRDEAGSISPTANVAVRLIPNPQDDLNLEATTGVPVVLSNRITNNDLGRTPIPGADRKIRVLPIASGTPGVAATEAELAQGYIGNLADLTAKGFALNPSTGEFRFTPLSSQEGETVSFYYYLVDSTSSGAAPYYYDPTRFARVDIKVKASIPPVSQDLEFRFPLATGNGTTKLSSETLPVLDEGLTYVIQRRLTGSDASGYLTRNGTETSPQSSFDIVRDGTLFYRQVKVGTGTSTVFRPHSATYEYVVKNEAGQVSNVSKISIWVSQYASRTQNSSGTFNVNFLQNMAVTSGVSVKSGYSRSASTCAAISGTGTATFSRKSRFNCTYIYELQKTGSQMGFDPGPFMFEVEVN